MFDLIDFDFYLSDDALWAKIHLIYFGICTYILYRGKGHQTVHIYETCYSPEH